MRQTEGQGADFRVQREECRPDRLVGREARGKWEPMPLALSAVVEAPEY